MGESETTTPCLDMLAAVRQNSVRVPSLDRRQQTCPLPGTVEMGWYLWTLYLAVLPGDSRDNQPPSLCVFSPPSRFATLKLVPGHPQLRNIRGTASQWGRRGRKGEGGFTQLQPVTASYSGFTMMRFVRATHPGCF